MKIDNSVDWYIKKSVSDKVGRGNNDRVDSGIDAKVVSGDCEVVELKVVDEDGSGDGISANKVIKCVQKVLSLLLVLNFLRRCWWSIN